MVRNQIKLENLGKCIITTNKNNRNLVEEHNKEGRYVEKKK
jgi:hypothetical protein